MRKTTFLYLSVIFFACLAVYANTFFVPFQFDDIVAIKSNVAIHSLSDIGLIWRYWPTRFLTFLSFALNYHFHGLKLPGYHLVNLLIHFTCSLLVFLLTKLFLEESGIQQPAKENIPLFTALVFAVHPVQTQAVTYIYQRSTCLATLFILLSVYLYLQARREKQPGKRRIRYLLAAASSLSGMFTKEIAITIPFLILITEIFFPAEKKLSISPALFFLFLLPVIPLTSLSTRLLRFSDFRAVSLQTIGQNQSLTQMQYLLTQFHGLLTYLRLLLVPVKQNIDYNYPRSYSLFEPGTLAGFLFLLTLLFLAVYLFQRNRLLSFSLFWFLLTLAPQSSFLPKPDLVVEHRLYLPGFGYCLFLIIFLSKYLRSSFLAASILSLICGLYGVLTLGRNIMWRSRVVLWDETVRQSPHKARPYVNRGVAFEEKGAYNLALKDYTTALTLEPDYAEAYLNRATLLAKLGRFQQAFQDFEKVEKLRPHSSSLANNRAVALALSGQLEKAIDEFNRALTINPRYAEALRNRGIAYFRSGKMELAIKDFNSAVNLNPEDPLSYYYRAIVYYQVGLSDKARQDLNQYSRLTGQDYSRLLQTMEKLKNNRSGIKIIFNAW